MGRSRRAVLGFICQASATLLFLTRFPRSSPSSAFGAISMSVNYCFTNPQPQNEQAKAFMFGPLLCSSDPSHFHGTCRVTRQRGWEAGEAAPEVSKGRSVGADTSPCGGHYMEAVGRRKSASLQCHPKFSNGGALCPDPSGVDREWIPVEDPLDPVSRTSLRFSSFPLVVCPL